MKKALVFFGLLAAIALPVHADENVLLQRIVALEKRIAELETKLAPVLEEERVKAVVGQQKKRAEERMMTDAEYYARSDLKLIETLYQTANQDWKSDEALKSLKVLIERFPRANRTGCAMLYLGQMTKGDEQLGYLKTAIEKYSDCFYGNGVQVGPYARLYLAMRCKAGGKDAEAEKLLQDIRTRFPDAVDHKGQLLASHLADME